MNGEIRGGDNVIPAPAVDTDPSYVRLGRVLAFHREERQVSVREAARRLKCDEDTIRRMERGEVVPNSEQWKAYTQGVSRQLHGYHELRLRAAADRKAADAKVATNLGEKMAAGRPLTAQERAWASVVGDDERDKAAGMDPRERRGIRLSPMPEALQAAQERKAAETPPPAPEPTPTPVNRTGAALTGLPEGWRTPKAREERKTHALELIRSRPAITDRDIIDELQAVHGVGLSPANIEQLREIVRDERRGARPPSLPAPQPPPARPRKVPETTSAAASAEADIRTAVELLLGAIANLRTCTVSVDDNGEASVSYTVREVRVVEAAGSFKVSR